VGVGGPWRVSMGCMDELMDKNISYFVGGNLATLVCISVGREPKRLNRSRCVWWVYSCGGTTESGTFESQWWIFSTLFAAGRNDAAYGYQYCSNLFTNGHATDFWISKLHQQTAIYSMKLIYVSLLLMMTFDVKEMILNFVLSIILFFKKNGNSMVLSEN